MRDRRMLLAFVATVLSVGMATSAVVGQEKINLKFGHLLADGPYLQVEQAFADHIAERTGGRVTIEITYSGGLGKGHQLLHEARLGAVDLATVPGSYYPDDLPFWKAFQIPFIFNSAHQAMDVLTISLKEFAIFKQEMDDMNVRWLFQQPIGSFYLTGPSPNCDSVAELRGKKIRSFSPEAHRVHSAIGAVPVLVRPLNVHDALRRGHLDYSFLNLGNIQQYALHTQGKYSCGPIMAVTGYSVVISKNSWNKLPPDIQQIFEEEAVRTQQAYRGWLDDFDQQAKSAILAEGHVIKPFPAEEMAKWMAAAHDPIGAWQLEMASKGLGELARPVAERWRELVAE